jgi:hypothetical protein
MAHLLVQDVVIKLCSDGLSASDLRKTLAEQLKSLGYNHAPSNLGTWGLTLGGELVWYVQVALYEKHLSFGVLVIHHTYYATLSAMFNDGIQDAAHEQLMQDIAENPLARVESKGSSLSA